MMIDFDDIDGWLPGMVSVLSEIVPDLKSAMAATRPEFIEDARDSLLVRAEYEDIVGAMVEWIRNSIICGYHGTRLADAELARVQTNGLLALEAGSRRTRLKRALSSSPRWTEVADKLDPMICNIERGEFGTRLGQVHLTLSRQGLLKGFNHYVKYGGEFDQMAACMLLGDEGLELLAKDGNPTLLKVAVPGSSALDAANPSFTVDDHLSRGSIPSLVRQFLESGCYRLAHPDFQPRSLKLDCGLMFREPIPAPWIVAAEEL